MNVWCLERVWHRNMHDSPFLASYHTSITLKDKFSGATWPWMPVVSSAAQLRKQNSLPSWRKNWLAKISWEVICLLVVLHECLKAFSRAIFTSCDFCLTGILGTNQFLWKCDSIGPLNPVTLSLIPCFPGEVLTGKARSRIRIGVALRGGWH